MNTSTLAAPVVMSAPVAPAKPAKVTFSSSLLETVRALDGNKADRHAVALAALTSAYTQALQHGNKTQLADMVGSTGKKVCERAMRTAVQVVGVPSVHKNAATRAGAIECAVMQALDIFASIACKETAPKQPRKDKSTAPVKATESTIAEFNAALDGETIETISMPVTDLIDNVIAMIQAGALTEDEIDAIETALIAQRMSTLPAVQPLQLTAH